MALDAGCSVLRLPLYHCILNPIKMVWSQLKHHAWRLNIYSSQPSKVVKLIPDVCDQKISSRQVKELCRSHYEGRENVS